MSQDPHTHVVCIRIQKHATPHSFFQLMLIIKHQRAVSHVKRKSDVFLISLNDTSEMRGRTMRQTCTNTNAWPNIHIHAITHTHATQPTSPFPHPPHSPAVSLLCILTIRWHPRSLSLSLTSRGKKTNAL